MKLPISAIVVCYNEAYLLKACLESLNFCEEILVVDLESTDDSVKIAQRYATKVISHERVPCVEYIHALFKDKVNFDWILLLDPDEVLDAKLADQIKRNFPFGDQIGMVTVPWIFYFKKYRFKGTRWGGNNKLKPNLVNRKRTILSTHVHRNRTLIPNFKEYNIVFKSDNVVHHYWMNSYKQFLFKHYRYIKKEGESKFYAGLRTNLFTIIKSPLSGFFDSFIIFRGYKDGFLGLFLSLFWAFYNFLSEWELYKYQILVHKQNRNAS